MQIRTTTRRELIAGSRGLALGVGAAAAIGIPSGEAASLPLPPPHPDAELLRLGVQLKAEAAKVDVWENDQTNASCSGEELEAVIAPARAVVDLIEHVPARTLEGLKVKAFAISWCNSGEEIDPDRFCPRHGATTDGRIAASIVRDLLAGRAWK